MSHLDRHYTYVRCILLDRLNMDSVKDQCSIISVSVGPSWAAALGLEGYGDPVGAWWSGLLTLVLWPLFTI